MEMEGVGCVLALLGDGQAIEGANQAEAGEVNVGGDLRGWVHSGVCRLPALRFCAGVFRSYLLLWLLLQNLPALPPPFPASSLHQTVRCAGLD